MPLHSLFVALYICVIHPCTGTFLPLLLDFLRLGAHVWCLHCPSSLCLSLAQVWHRMRSRYICLGSNSDSKHYELHKQPLRTA